MISKPELSTSSQSLFATENIKAQESSLRKPISPVFEPPKDDNLVKPKPVLSYENSIKLFSGPELKHNEIIPKPELPTSNQSINSIGMQEKPASLFDRTHNLNMEIAKSGLFSGSSLFSKNVNQKQGSLFENPSVPSAENQLKTNESIQNKESPTIDNIKKTDMSLEKPQSSIIPQSLLFNQPISSTPLFSSLFNQSSGSQKPENSPIKQSSLFGNIPQQSGGLFSSSSTNLFPSTLFGNTSAGWNLSSNSSLTNIPYQFNAKSEAKNPGSGSSSLFTTNQNTSKPSVPLNPFFKQNPPSNESDFLEEEGFAPDSGDEDENDD